MDECEECPPPIVEAVENLEEAEDISKEVVRRKVMSEEGESEVVYNGEKMSEEEAEKQKESEEKRRICFRVKPEVEQEIRSLHEKTEIPLSRLLEIKFENPSKYLDLASTFLEEEEEVKGTNYFREKIKERMKSSLEEMGEEESETED